MLMKHIFTCTLYLQGIDATILPKVNATPFGLICGDKRVHIFYMNFIYYWRHVNKLIKVYSSCYERHLAGKGDLLCHPGITLNNRLSVARVHFDVFCR